MISGKKYGNRRVKNIKSKHKMRQSESCNRSVPVIKFKYDRESICF
nr:MAG TPA: hypothetical protein [Caudoviricetes sp.]